MSTRRPIETSSLTDCFVNNHHLMMHEVGVSIVSEPMIVWTKNHTIYPALDFIDDEAFVTVPLTIEKQVKKEACEDNTTRVKKPIVITDSKKWFEVDLDVFRKLDLDVQRLPVIPGLRWSKTSIQSFLNGSFYVDKREILFYMLTIKFWIGNAIVG